jgi:hypothetical protein
VRERGVGERVGERGGRGVEGAQKMGGERGNLARGARG